MSEYQDAHYFHLQFHLLLPLRRFFRIAHTLWEEIKVVWNFLDERMWAFHSSVNLSSSHSTREEKTNHRHSIWTLFPKLRLPVATRSLKKSIAQDKYIRLKWDRKVSILWSGVDDPYLCTSALHANLHCTPGIRQF